MPLTDLTEIITVFLKQLYFKISNHTRAVGFNVISFTRHFKYFWVQ